MKGLVAAKSEIDKSFQMFVIYSEHEKYASDFAPIFKSHGLGFLVPGKKQIYIDGESLKDLTYDHLLAIQAHEISHYRLKHKGDYSEKQELEADVEGYKILVDGNYTKAAVILRQRIKDHYGKRGLKMLGENKINNKMKSKHIKSFKDFNESVTEKFMDSQIDQIAQKEFGMDYDQLGKREKEWVRDEIDNLTEAASAISMPEAEKVWDALVKKFSDNKNDSIEYLNKDKSYRNMAITAIFVATKF